MVTLVFGLLMTRILSGHFSVHDYGTYSQIILLVTTVTSITILGMVDGVNYFFCKETDVQKRNAYISTIFVMQAVASLIASLTVLGCTIPISQYFNNSDIRGLIIFAALLPVLQNMISLLQIMFIAIGRAKHIAIRNLLVAVFKLVAILFACYVFNNIAIVLVCQVVLEVAQVAYFVISLRRNSCKINLGDFNKTLIGEILKYCIPMAMFTIVKSLNRDCDKYVIAAFTDTETLAIYTNASKQLPFDIIMTSFCTVLLPYITRYISKKDYSRTQVLYKSFLELSCISTAILALGAVCVSPELMKFLYTEKYISGLSIFIVYIFVDVLSVFNITLLLSAAGKTKTIMCVGVGAFIANLILNILFYHLLGLIGPAVATLVVTLLQGVVMLSMSAKVIQTSFLKMFNKKFMCIFMLELVVGCVVVSTLRCWLVGLRLPEFGVMCICCLTFMFPLGLINFRRLKQNLNIINSCKS